MHYHISIKPSPRNWSESSMATVVDKKKDIVYEGTIKQVSDWIEGKCLYYVAGTNGVWTDNTMSVFEKKYYDMLNFLRGVNGKSKKTISRFKAHEH